MYRAAVGNVVVAERLRAAHTHWSRLRGLLGTTGLPAGGGLWIKPCNRIHTIGMRYAVDVAFLDDGGRVVATVPELVPNRLSPHVPAATAVLELPAGTLARTGLRERAQVAIDGEPDPEPAAWLDTLAAAACNLAVAAFYAFFAAAHLTKARATGQWATTLPLVLQEAMLVVLFLFRRPSRVTSTRPRDWTLGIAGTFLPLLMRPADSPGSLAWLGQPVQVAGLLVAVAGIASLGRSIGVVAANRGIRTGGVYRVVRHPMYAGYVLGYLGYLAAYPSVRNSTLTVLTLIALTVRAVVEERLLARDPDYRAYLRRTRSRFVPWVC